MSKIDWSILAAFLSLTIYSAIAGLRAPTNEMIAARIAASLNTNPHVIVEIRPNGDGTFSPSLDAEVVKQVVMEELNRP